MKKRPPEPPGDIPAWVMTFSDVITLLMTFFILLLTFATNEPESFQPMQEAMFSGSGADGIAGEASANPKNAVLLRQRTNAGRSTSRGSEIPPVKTAPTKSSMSDGIAGLEDHENRELSTTHSLRLSWSELLDSDGALTTTGAQQLRMIAFQVQRQDLSLRLVIGRADRFDSTMEVYQHFVANGGLKPTEVGVGQNRQVKGDVLAIEITKRFASTQHGS